MIPVKDIEIGKATSVKDLIKQFGEAGGFSAKKVAEGVTILRTMFAEDRCTKILSFPAAIISTGTRGVVKDLLKQKKVDVVITTCGTLDHDLARVFQDYYHGDFMMDDAKLRKQGINRLGNVLVPDSSYGEVMANHMNKILTELHSKNVKEISTKELCWAIGEYISKTSKKREESILYWAWKNKIPVFIPGPTDGSVGSQIWMFSQKTDFRLNILKDEQDLSNIVFDAKSLGALMIGGGISKHHTIWWAQFGNGLDYAVYITTAVEYDGSLSGAQTREAISWGKLKEQAKHITIEGDATVLLPLMITAL